MADLDTLRSQYGREDVAKAMWLSQKIRDDGLEGIGFMYGHPNKGQSAKAKGEQIAHITIRKAIYDKF